METFRHIRVTTLTKSDCIREVFNLSTDVFSYTGLCADILNYVCNKYNYTYEVNTLDVQDWGVVQTDGRWSGILYTVFLSDNIGYSYEL